jgi:class 3 adenylate cyclase
MRHNLTDPLLSGDLVRIAGPAIVGFIGDALNLSTRLTGEAEPGEIVISNPFYQALDEDLQSEFVENRPIVAKNIGTLRS